MSRVKARHRLGPKRDPAVDGAVLAATRASLVDVGYAGTTLEGVARLAGVSRPAIYRRWPSKALLVHEAVFPGDAVDAGAASSLAGEVARLVRATLDLFASPTARAAIPGLMMEMRSDPTLRERFSARIEQEARRRFADEVVGPAVDDGEARPGVDADTLFDAIIGAVLFAACVRDIEHVDTFAATLTDLLQQGFEAREARSAVARTVPAGASSSRRPPSAGRPAPPG